METALIVAKIMGIYLVVSGLFMMFRGKTVPHMLKDFFGHSAIVYLTGVILIFLSSLYLLQGNVWDGTWRSVVTIFVWLVLGKGLLYIFAPDMLQKTVSKRTMSSLGAYGIVAIIAGLGLFFIG
jgi:hypothetical protein